MRVRARGKGGRSGLEGKGEGEGEGEGERFPARARSQSVSQWVSKVRGSLPGPCWENDLAVVDGDGVTPVGRG